MTSWIRQYSLRDLLDDSFDLFKERAVALLLVGTIPYLFFVAFAVLMRTVYVPENFVNEWKFDTNSNTLWQLLSNPRFWVFILSISFAGFLAFTVSYLAQCRVAIEAAQGNVISTGKAFSRLVKPFFSLLLISIMFSIVVSVALTFVTLLCLVLVGILIMLVAAISRGAISDNSTGGAAIVYGILSIVSMAMLVLANLLVIFFFAAGILTAPVAMVNENAGPFVALGRAMKISRANFSAQYWSTVVVGLMQSIIWPSLVVIQLLLFMIVKPFAPTMDNTLVGSLAGGLSLIVYLGLFSCLQALAYLDGRSRTESYDLLVMARQIGLEQEFKRAFSITNQTPVYFDKQQPANAQQYGGYPDYSRAPGMQMEDYPTIVPVAEVMSYPDYNAPPPPVVVGSVPAEALEQEEEQKHDS